MELTPFQKSLAADSLVFWSDPDDHISSGWYTVAAIHLDDGEERSADTLVSIKNDAGSCAEVPLSELSDTPPSELGMATDRL